MSKEKEFQEPIEKYYRSDESKCGSIQEDDSAYRKEIKAAHQSCSNRQYNQKEDPKETIVSTFDPRSMPIEIILQAIMHSGGDKTLRAEDIIKIYGLDKTKADILKVFIISYANYSFTSESYRPGNVIGALQANGSSSHPSRKYSNNHSNFLAAYQTVNSYADADTNGVAASLFSYLHQKAQSGMSYQNFHPSPPLLVATDGSGGNDPECTKMSITSMHYGRPDISTSFMRYLVELKSKNSKEIHSEVPVKEDYSLKSLDKQEVWLLYCQCFLYLIFLHFRVMLIMRDPKVSHNGSQECTICCLLFTVKKFCCFTSSSSFPKKASQLPAFMSCVNSLLQKFARKFHGCKVICEKCETFSLQIISNIHYYYVFFRGKKL